ncbi:MAG: ATP synthase F1 subunit gamma [Candidatus Magasanikbacteria bacterium RIFOXYD2_FULL_39_9]|uniref:ATP synthase gamma chain n=1 Tax=Candidatus Magasanikbacteria bacterium RIFOXYD1_FULL_40_23 TaxID=1798705 RepID=A0A1F6PAT5_9BACT|nr:MAG: ATP synthase F1 subunit gamma [Candidatus Magasanikbacteria bacterium RIFOXYD2_FULL_39_9]OGH93291.1 MAG: ATP synthase F1 subunit gamma [Candidatus Magasanikbacteria bacterium RIFOXYD1_FULL_40_23]
MAINTKVIKRRLKSIGSTKKITKAMEMIAAAKMRKAVSAAIDTRAYSSLAWELLVNLSKTQKVQIPLLEARQVKKILVIMITSNRGLCGSFNANIIKKTALQMKDPKNIAKQVIDGKEILPSDRVEVDVIGIGKKGADFAKKMGYNLTAAFSNMTDTPNFDDALPIAKMVIDAYEKKTYDKVIVAYTDFKSALVQTARLRQVLPISESDLEKTLFDTEEKNSVKEKTNLNDYLFEPNRTDVLQIILPRLVETQIYQTMLESSASEHSSRMVAMKAASEAAKDMISELNLTFNKARQAGITQEIAEIAGGAAALE